METPQSHFGSIGEQTYQSLSNSENLIQLGDKQIEFTSPISKEMRKISFTCLQGDSPPKKLTLNIGKKTPLYHQIQKEFDSGNVAIKAILVKYISLLTGVHQTAGKKKVFAKFKEEECQTVLTGDKISNAQKLEEKHIREVKLKLSKLATTEKIQKVVAKALNPEKIYKAKEKIKQLKGDRDLPKDLEGKIEDLKMSRTLSEIKTKRKEILKEIQDIQEQEVESSQEIEKRKNSKRKTPERKKTADKPVIESKPVDIVAEKKGKLSEINQKLASLKNDSDISYTNLVVMEEEFDENRFPLNDFTQKFQEIKEQFNQLSQDNFSDIENDALSFNGKLEEFTSHLNDFRAIFEDRVSKKEPFNLLSQKVKDLKEEFDRAHSLSTPLPRWDRALIIKKQNELDAQIKDVFQDKKDLSYTYPKVDQLVSKLWDLKLPNHSEIDQKFEQMDQKVFNFTERFGNLENPSPQEYQTFLQEREDLIEEISYELYDSVASNYKHPEVLGLNDILLKMKFDPNLLNEPQDASPSSQPDMESLSSTQEQKFAQKVSLVNSDKENIMSKIPQDLKNLNKRELITLRIKIYDQKNRTEATRLELYKQAEDLNLLTEHALSSHGPHSSESYQRDSWCSKVFNQLREVDDLLEQKDQNLKKQIDTLDASIPSQAPNNSLHQEPGEVQNEPAGQVRESNIERILEKKNEYEVNIDFKADERSMQRNILNGIKGVAKIPNPRAINTTVGEYSRIHQQWKYDQHVDPRGDGNCGISAQTSILAEGLKQNVVDKQRVLRLMEDTKLFLDHCKIRDNKYIFEKVEEGEKILTQLLENPSRLDELINTHEKHQALIYFVRQMTLVATLANPEHYKSHEEYFNFLGDGVMGAAMGDAKTLAKFSENSDWSSSLIFFKSLGAVPQILINDGSSITEKKITPNEGDQVIKNACFYRGLGHFHAFYK